MKQILNGLRVALAACVLVGLPSFGFWCAGAINLQPPPVYSPRVVSRPVHADPGTQWRGGAWQPPTQRMEHYSGNHDRGNR